MYFPIWKSWTQHTARKEYWKSQRLYSNPFSETPPIFLFKVLFLPSKSWQHKWSQSTSLFGVTQRSENIYAWTARQVVLHSYLEFCKKKKKESDAAILNYRILKAAFHQHFNLKGLLILKMKWSAREKFTKRTKSSITSIAFWLEQS